MATIKRATFFCALLTLISNADFAPIEKKIFNDPASINDLHSLHQDSETDNRVYSYDDSSSYPKSRFKRGAGKASQLYNHAAIIARITNGIALQSGLMSGSIIIDDVLAELLNFGTLKISDVVNFKSDQITQLLNEIKTMPNILKADSDLDSFEVRTAAWNELRKSYESLPDFQKFPIGDKFFDDVRQYLRSTHFKGALSIANGFKDLKEILEKIDANADHLPFLNFHSKYKEICDAFKNIKEIHKELQVSPNFEKSISELRHVDNFVRIVTSRKSIMSLKSGHIDQLAPMLKMEFESLKKLSASSNSAQKNTQLLSSFFKSITNPQQTIRKITPGFTNGISDVLQVSNDTSNAWLQKAVSTKGDIKSLAKGLRPLIKNMERVGQIESQLSTLSSQDLFRDFAQMQAQISSLHPSLADHTRVFEKTSKCGAVSTVVTSHIEDILNLAKDLPNRSVNPRSSLSTLFSMDLTEFKKTTDDFIKSWGFTDLNNLAQVQQEISKVTGQLDGGKTTAMNSMLDTWQAKTISVGGIGSLKDDLSKISTGSTIVENFFKNEAKHEKDVLTCLQNHKEESESAANGIYLIRNLRSQTSKTTGDVESALAAFSKVSKALPALKSIPADMKKEIDSHVTNLNNITDALKTSNIIGESVNVLRGAVALAELEPKMPELKAADSQFQKGISNISSPLDKQKIEAKWGDHQQDMTSLEVGVKKAVEFDGKLDASKVRRRRRAAGSLEDLGKSFPNLAGIPDVNIDFEGKVEALEDVIRRTPDPQVKAELEKTKAILKKLAARDLKFSKHQATLNSAPAAFKKIHEFLERFVSKNIVEQEQEQSEESKKDEESGFNYVNIIIYVAVVIFVAVLIAVIICFVMKSKRSSDEARKAKRKARKAEKQAHKAEEKFIDAEKRLALLNKAQPCNSQKLNTTAEMFIKFLEEKIEQGFGMFSKSHVSRFTVLVTDDTNSKEKADVDHRWSDVTCNPKTVVTVTYRGVPQLLHANYVYTALGKVFIATQAPTLKTIVLYFQMILDKKVEFVFMLCRWTENGHKKADRYFNDAVGGEMKFDDFIVKTTSSEDIVGGKATKRTIVVNNVRTKQTHSFVLVQDNVWPDKGVPEDTTLVYEMLKMAQTSETPVVVHCSAGIGRSGTLITIQCAIDEGKIDVDFKLDHCFFKVRNARWWAIQTVGQCMYIQLAYWYCMSMEFNIPLTAYEKLLEVFKREIKTDVARIDRKAVLGNI